MYTNNQQKSKTKMKRILFLITMAACVTLVSAQSKRQLRVTYILEQMQMDNATVAKVKPTIVAFIDALANNKDKHDEVQDKYQAAEEKGTLTDAQAEILMQSKFNKDAGELEVRRQYYARLKNIVGAAKARRILALSNDKLNKAQKQ